MQDEVPFLIFGARHSDERGSIGFVNEFDMKDVRRFYRVNNNNINPKRGWRAHKMERRWFSVLAGAFKIDVKKIDNWESPSKTLPSQSYSLTNDNSVLYVPCGYATCITEIESGSEVIIFADSLIGNASKDDYLFPLDYFSH